jgi:predicted Zn-dependent peptidase
MRGSGASLVAVAIWLVTLATPVVAGEPYGVTHTRLANGLTVLVRKNTTAPVVAVTLAVRMGTRWETEATAGLSNFVQIMVVRGTSSRSGIQIVQDAEQLGGRIDAPSRARTTRR